MRQKPNYVRSAVQDDAASRFIKEYSFPTKIAQSPFSDLPMQDRKKKLQGVGLENELDKERRSRGWVKWVNEAGQQPLAA